MEARCLASATSSTGYPPGALSTTLAISCPERSRSRVWARTISAQMRRLTGRESKWRNATRTASMIRGSGESDCLAIASRRSAEARAPGNLELASASYASSRLPRSAAILALSQRLRCAATGTGQVPSSSASPVASLRNT